MTETITQRQLNRTLLSRQLLLERCDIRPLAAMERLAGMQSQIPNPPYIGLWTRLASFQKAELTALLGSREVVRAPWIRSTLHLVSAADHQRFQVVIQPALARSLRSFFGKRARDLDIPRLIEIAIPFLETETPAIGALRDELQRHFPQHDKEAMAYAVRSFLPMLQTPPSGAWGVGTRATYTTAANWLGEAKQSDLATLFRRYLAAFGPASVMDFQTWCGITSLKTALAPVLKTLVAYRSEAGAQLVDLPDLPLLPEHAPALIRFLPEYDNILIAHKDRARILPEPHRKKVFLSAGRVLGAVLIDGFVGAIWKVSREKSRARLSINLFEAVAAECQAAIEAEGLRLLRFIDEDAGDYAVEFD
ncbi:MAG: winged helix DNA-binding domain-containing protein [Chloroflexi bacterium]|nr:winged helix DNA-binding domain-containing protein [Chloroflexota bacterium]MCY4246735.1 winged helix DNA-binding domain-containing protein [Chloroflexota bacterium]